MADASKKIEDFLGDTTAKTEHAEMIDNENYMSNLVNDLKFKSETGTKEYEDDLSQDDLDYIFNFKG